MDQTSGLGKPRSPSAPRLIAWCRILPGSRLDPQLDQGRSGADLACNQLFCVWYWFLGEFLCPKRLNMLFESIEPCWELVLSGYHRNPWPGCALYTVLYMHLITDWLNRAHVLFNPTETWTLEFTSELMLCMHYLSVFQYYWLCLCIHKVGTLLFTVCTVFICWLITPSLLVMHVHT